MRKPGPPKSMARPFPSFGNNKQSGWPVSTELLGAKASPKGGWPVSTQNGMAGLFNAKLPANAQPNFLDSGQTVDQSPVIQGQYLKPASAGGGEKLNPSVLADAVDRFGFNNPSWQAGPNNLDSFFKQFQNPNTGSQFRNLFNKVRQPSMQDQFRGMANKIVPLGQ